MIDYLTAICFMAKDQFKNIINVVLYLIYLNKNS
jgi:hypothetical protein